MIFQVTTSPWVSFYLDISSSLWYCVTHFVGEIDEGTGGYSICTGSLRSRPVRANSLTCTVLFFLLHNDGWKIRSRIQQDMIETEFLTNCSNFKLHATNRGKKFVLHGHVNSRGNLAEERLAWGRRRADRRGQIQFIWIDVFWLHVFVVLSLVLLYRASARRSEQITHASTWA